MAAFTPLTILLEAYRPSYSEEIVFKKQFSELLLHPRAYHRDHLPGHITGSAWVTDTSRTKVLLLHHAKLDRWLQPGGHADGDENVLAVAQRELEEETGITTTKLLLSEIYDLDIHPIPARKDFPAHFHYDVRFLFEASAESAIEVSDESFDVKWIDVDSLKSFTDNVSMYRMAEKLRIVLTGF